MAPELLYLESKWASLVSYGLTVKALRDFLPVDAKLNATSVRRHALRVARRCEADLRAQGEPAGRPTARSNEGLGAVGTNGGYPRHRTRKQSHFVAIGRQVRAHQ
jgi:hypothetical protein